MSILLIVSLVVLAIIVVSVLAFTAIEFLLWLKDHKAWEAKQAQPIIQLWSGMDKPVSMSATQYLHQLKGNTP